MDTFLGEKASFWIELKKRAENLQATSLLREIAELHARVGFYESKFKEIEAFQQAIKGGFADSK